MQIQDAAVSALLRANAVLKGLNLSVTLFLAMSKLKGRPESLAFVRQFLEFKPVLFLLKIDLVSRLVGGGEVV